MFKKIILKDKNENEDTSLKFRKKENNSFHHYLDNYCGECVFYNWHTHVCDKKNKNFKSSDLACDEHFESLYPL